MPTTIKQQITVLQALKKTALEKRDSHKPMSEAYHFQQYHVDTIDGIIGNLWQLDAIIGVTSRVHKECQVPEMSEIADYLGKPHFSLEDLSPLEQYVWREEPDPRKLQRLVDYLVNADHSGTVS